jgi:hypothetical protein
MSNDDDTQWVPYVEDAQDQDPAAAATTGGDASNHNGSIGPSTNSAIASRNPRTGHGG